MMRLIRTCNSKASRPGQSVMYWIPALTGQKAELYLLAGPKDDRTCFNTFTRTCVCMCVYICVCVITLASNCYYGTCMDCNKTRMQCLFLTTNLKTRLDTWSSGSGGNLLLTLQTLQRHSRKLWHLYAAGAFLHLPLRRRGFSPRSLQMYQGRLSSSNSNRINSNNRTWTMWMQWQGWVGSWRDWPYS